MSALPSKADITGPRGPVPFRRSIAIAKTQRLQQAQLNARMSTPDYHRLGGEQVRGDRKRLEELEALLLQKFARWEWLEERHSRSA